MAIVTQRLEKIVHGLTVKGLEVSAAEMHFSLYQIKENKVPKGDVLKTAEAGWLLVSYQVIPDEEKVIRNTLIRLADKEQVDLILTTGGTGLAKRDVTPEATKKVIEKEIPGISETMRMKSSDKSPYAILSRGISGFRKNTLVVNLPGSPRGVSTSSKSAKGPLAT